MPADEYASAGAGGALKLKGAKIQKTKKKKKSKGIDKDKATNLERSLPATTSTDARSTVQHHDGDDVEKKGMADPESEPESEYKTEAERRHEEAMKKKVTYPNNNTSAYTTDRGQGVLEADCCFADATNARGPRTRIGDPEDS